MGWILSCFIFMVPSVMAMGTWLRAANKFLERQAVLNPAIIEQTKTNNDVCVRGCSSHGVCENFECRCKAGWAPPDCSIRTCEGVPCMNGECYNGHCYCDLLWTGAKCDRPLCPNGCSNRGKCKFGSCECKSDFTGVDCSIPVCPAGCSGHGRCVAPVYPLYYGEDNLNTNVFPPHCLCESGWTGNSCGVRSCPRACSGHGICRPANATHLACECLGGYTGIDCADNRCPSDCFSELGRGRCDREGRCHCAFGYSMPDCAERQQCDQECFAHGHCSNNECICDQGWFGTNCISNDEHNSQKFVPGMPGLPNRPDCYAPKDIKAGIPRPCSGQGICITERGCVCDPLVYGKQCQYSVCPGVEHCNKECCGNGKCNPTNGKCQCKPGWEGPDCFFRSCPAGCSGHGECNALGQCECHGLWGGDKCQHRQCLHDCSQHGRCVNGSCVCAHKHRGLDCSLAACPVHPTTRKVCSGIGYCNVDGSCICPDSANVRFGRACEQIGLHTNHTKSEFQIDSGSTSPDTVSDLGSVAVPCAKSCMSVCMQRTGARTRGHPLGKRAHKFWNDCYMRCNAACISNCWTHGDSCE